MPTQRRIHFVTPIDSKVFQHLRVELPCKYLQGLKSITVNSGPIEEIEEADAVVFANVPGVRAVEYVHRLFGQTNIIWQLDDNFWELPASNPAAEKIQRYEIEGLNRCLSMADWIWVTTYQLEEACRKRGFHKVRVVPTLVEIPTYTRTQPLKRCLWAGSNTHAEDLELIAHLPALMPDWQFVFFGALPPSLTDTFCTDRRTQLLIRPTLPNVGYVPPVPFNRYQKVLQELAATSLVGLCPLVDNQFNSCKSPLKALEFMSLHLPVVASDCLPYSGLIDSGWSGYLVEQPEQWQCSIEAACSEDTFALAGHGLVEKDFNWATTWEDIEYGNQRFNRQHNKQVWLNAIREATSTKVGISWGESGA